MKRVRVREHKALVFVTLLAAGAVIGYGCVPTPDTSGLPPYDGGPSPIFDANFATGFDAGDVNVAPNEDGGTEDAGGDAGPQTGTIVGLVIDFTEGNGEGVVPGATVSVLGGATTTTNAFGAFVLPGVPAGKVQLNVGKATDTVNQIAYSSTQTVLTLAGGQTASAFPVIHEGCYESIDLSATPVPVTMADSTMLCPYNTTGQGNRTAEYAALTYGATSFTDPVNGTTYTGTARVEMIPIAFPTTGATAAIPDYSWSVGLPGASTPVELLGAVQIRVIAANGDPLAVRTGDTSVGVTIATTRAFTAGEGVALWDYDSVAGAWSPLANAGAPVPGTIDTGGFTVGTTTAIPSLPASWLALTKPSQPTSCITGTLTATAGSVSGVVVHAVGTNYFGTGTGVTDATGAFCVNVAAAPGDGGAGPSIHVVGASVQAGGTAFITAQSSPATVTTLAGSCATPSACTPIGSIPMTALDPTCLAGNLTNTTTPSLDVDLVNISVSASQQNAGIRTAAYIGTITPGDGGAFCAAAPAGATVQFLEQNTSGCGTATVTTLVGGLGATCGTGGCQDAGALTAGCF